jgi:hypothetical protein
MMRPSSPAPTATEIGAPVVGHFLATHQPFADVHSDGAYGVFAKLLRDFQHQPALIGGFQRVEDRRQVVKAGCFCCFAVGM